MRNLRDEGCPHWNLSLAERTLADGRSDVVYQCTDCGLALSFPIAREVVDELVVGGEALGVFDKELETHGLREQRERRTQESRERTERWFAEHSEYLRSPQWAEKRRLVLLRCRGVCEGCGSAPATEVHHLTYEHWKSELLFELVGLCKPCHERAHEGGGLE